MGQIQDWRGQQIEIARSAGGVVAAAAPWENVVRTGVQPWPPPELVVQAASDGDPDAVRRRLDLLEGIPAVAVTADAVSFARSLVENRVVPRTAEADALHIAIAAAGGMEYLLTWNCRHIANAQIRGKIEELARLRGFEPPILCTPEELMETDQ